MKKRDIPPLNALRAFEAAARHCNFRLAAEELHVTHSAISHQIKLLEERLGVQLFRRTVRTVTLTEEGEQLYPCLRDAFDLISDGVQGVKAVQTSNVLTLQVYVTFAGWLIPRLPDFRRRHPDIQLHINTSSLDATFEKSDVDAAVLMGYKTQQTIEYDYLFTSQLVPVCSQAFLDHSQPINSPADIQPAQLLTIANAEQDWPNWFAAAGLEAPEQSKGTRFDSYSLALDAAIDGAGIALALLPFRKKDLREGRLVTPFDIKAPAYGDWYFAYRQKRGRSAKVRAFRSWLLGQIADDNDIDIKSLPVS